MRVLLIDDNPQIRTVVQRIITALGHEAFLAEDGGEGISAALSNPFDIILIDLELPDMDGFAVSRTLRDAGSAARRVALSAHPPDRAREERDTAGFTTSLTKPVDIAALARLLAG